MVKRTWTGNRTYKLPIFGGYKGVLTGETVLVSEEEAARLDAVGGWVADEDAEVGHPALLEEKALAASPEDKQVKRRAVKKK